MCGLFGKISRETSDFEIDKFNVLGVMNDDRGGDSVGIFIDGEVEYGVLEQKYYHEFMYKSDLLKKTKRSRIALGHTRKASIGKISEETAQPVCIRNKDGEIEFVLIHNGTIFNYEKLANEFIPFIEIKSLTDSQVMANIFYHCGYKEVLEKYEGAMAMVAVDYREDRNNPEVYLFKGASNKYRYSKSIEEERPLFITHADNAIWFSSMGKMLKAVNYPKDVLVLKSNVLGKVGFYNGKFDVYVEEKIDRSQMFQYKNAHEQNKEYSTARIFYDYDKKSDKTTKTDNSSPKGGFSLPSGTKWIDVQKCYASDRVSIHSDGFYYMNNELAHGKMSLGDSGYIKPKSMQSVINSGYKDYWFYMGRLLPGRDAWDYLVTGEKSRAVTPEEFVKDFREFVDLYSYIPIVNILSTNPIEAEFFVQESHDKIDFFTGTIRPMFSYNTFAFDVKDGIITDKRYGISAYEAKNAFEEFCDLWTIDYLKQ